MSKSVYIEPRPKGREGEPVSHYVVEEAGDHVLHKAATQEDAINWAKKQGYTPYVARVRHLLDKPNPDHWRKV